jgi:hypothetical protein
MPTKSLAKKILETRRTGKAVDTPLRTAQQVLARITEGIYREPSSALRELVSNAYDADATEVIILTDAPRFNKMIIRDNGNGLTPEALENLLTNIGASPKQSRLGARIGVTDAKDVTRSKGGRKLIGRLGIGLFSVAQLTRHFQVITKTKGSKFRTIADIALSILSEEKQDGKFEAGTARIWTEPAADVDSQGTEIILLELRTRTRDELASFDRWERLEAQDESSGLPAVIPPRYHIGRVSKQDRDLLLIEPNLPWNKEDEPLQRFRKLVEAMFDEVGRTESNPSLEATFDTYLQTIWKVSLAAPLDYIETYPFDLTPKSGLKFFQLSNEKRGQAQEISLKQKESIRGRLHYKTPDRPPDDKFEVIIDGLQLRRPIRFSNLPSTSNVIQTPLMFVGSYSPPLAGVAEELSGGPLYFEAYLFWSSVIVPKEHRGVMVRIGDASGTLFDPTFMGYQVSEQTRLRQLSSEIFVLEGLDAAINIDRESFNYSHPHYQIIVKWLHGAIKQFTNKHKEIGKHLREARLDEEADAQSSELQKTISGKIEELGIKRPANVVLVDEVETQQVETLRKRGTLVFSKTRLLSSFAKAGRTGKLKKKKAALLEQKITGAIQLLDAWGLLQDMPYEEQQRLLKDLIEIFTFNSKDE